MCFDHLIATILSNLIIYVLGCLTNPQCPTTIRHPWNMGRHTSKQEKKTAKRQPQKRVTSPLGGDGSSLYVLEDASLGGENVRSNQNHLYDSKNSHPAKYVNMYHQGWEYERKGKTHQANK